MIDKIAAAIVFIVSFVMVTALLAFLNLQYNNIFEFDFSPTQHNVEIKTKAQIDELKAELRPQIEKHVFDSLKVVGFDSAAIMNTNKKVEILEDSIVVLQKSVAQLKREATDLETKNTKFEEKEDTEAEYKSWVSKTSKLYESMDAQKAAKIILKYSDNIAKDILYSMKKKKAAEILAEINPETAKRITRVP